MSRPAANVRPLSREPDIATLQEAPPPPAQREWTTAATLLAVVALVLVPRLFVFPWNENYYGDAVMRTELAERWLRNPHWMSSFRDGAYQFGPVHLYAIAGALKLWPDREHAGRLVSLVAGVLSVLPLYFLTRRLFGKASATVAAFGFACWGMHVQMSTTAASEALSLFFVLCALEAFARTVSDRRVPSLVLSAVWMSLACATRYDAWMMVALLCVTLWFSFGWREGFSWGVLFGLLCLPFPLVWMLGNWRATGDALYPLHFIDAYHREWWGDGAALFGQLSYRLQNLFFWPGTALLTLSPLLGLFGIVGMANSVRKREHRWLAAFVLLPTLYFTVRSALLGTFVPLGRFAAVQIALLLPYVKPGFDALASRLPRLAARSVWGVCITCAVILPLWLGWFTFRREGKFENWLRPVSPTSTNANGLMAAARWVKQEVKARGEGLILDSDEQYRDIQLAFFGGLPEERMARYRWEDFSELLERARPRYLALFNRGSLERDGKVRRDAGGLWFGGAFFRSVPLPPGPVSLFVRD